MTNKQFFFLFAGNFAVLFTGMGLFPLLPLYATTLGATPTLVGFYFASIFAANALGPMAAGWLSHYLATRTTFVAAGIAGVVALILLGQATTLTQAILLTAVIWFAGGVSLTLVTVFVGMQATAAKRGRWFSMLAVASPLGALLGSAMVGQIVAHYGYSAAFYFLAAVWGILPFIGLWRLPQLEQPATTLSSTGRAAPFGRQFYLLLSVCFLGALTLSVGQLGTPLSMQLLAYSAASVASTSTVGGLVAIPVVLFIGTLSDRWGRARLLMATYLLAATGIGLLTVASQLWHFWLAASLIMVAASASVAIVSALASDWLPAASLSQGLPWLGFIGSGAYILSFAFSGLIIDNWGSAVLYTIGIVTAVLAVLRLHWLPARWRLLQPAV